MILNFKTFDPLHPRARKRFGQHFLEQAWVNKLIAALGTDPEDTFLEIGPGRGALTRALAPHVARIVAVEIDRDLAAALWRTRRPMCALSPATFFTST